MVKNDKPAVGMVLETALYVEDLQRSLAFYRKVLYLRPASQPVDRMGALQINEHQVLLLFKKGASTSAAVTPYGTIPPHDGAGNLHVAFSIQRQDLASWRQRLADHGIAIESTVEWPGGGSSIYFRDPDNHAIELKTSNWFGKEL